MWHDLPVSVKEINTKCCSLWTRPRIFGGSVRLFFSWTELSLPVSAFIHFIRWHWPQQLEALCEPPAGECEHNKTRQGVQHHHFCVISEHNLDEDFWGGPKSVSCLWILQLDYYESPEMALLVTWWGEASSSIHWAVSLCPLLVKVTEIF